MRLKLFLKGFECLVCVFIFVILEFWCVASEAERNGGVRVIITASCWPGAGGGGCVHG